MVVLLGSHGAGKRAALRVLVNGSENWRPWRSLCGTANLVPCHTGNKLYDILCDRLQAKDYYLEESDELATTLIQLARDL